MHSGFIDSFALLDLSGRVILVAIGLCLVVALVCHRLVRSRYDRIRRDLARNGPSQLFESALLTRIVEDVQDLVKRSGRLVDPSTLNTQAIIEHQIHRTLRTALLAERYVRAAGSLVIVLGLVGTFYGLTLSIGRLVGLVSGEARETQDLTQALTGGLSDALGGMSVAFTTSLAGISCAVLLTLVGVASSLSEQRAGLVLAIETYLDRVLAQAPGVSPTQRTEGGALGAPAAGGVHAAEQEALHETVLAFNEGVERLQETMGQFEAALHNFASTTRDFREFNLHLKDNVQRMSLNFGDFSEALRSQVERLRNNGRG